MWCLGIWVSGGRGSVRFMVGLDVLKGLFQPKRLYDSMTSTGSLKRPHVRQPQPSCRTSTTPVSAGETTQQVLQPEVLPGAGHVPKPLQGTVPIAPKWLKESGLQPSPPQLQSHSQSWAVFSCKSPRFFSVSLNTWAQTHPGPVSPSCPGPVGPARGSGAQRA